MNPHPQGVPPSGPPQGPPYGGMPISQAPRRHDIPYSPVPPNMRPQPAYHPGYYHPHMGGPMPQYPPHFAPPHWYGYPPMHHQQHPPPRMYQPYQAQPMHMMHPNGSMISPYAPVHSPHTPSNAPPFRRQQSSASPSHAQYTPQTNGATSTPLQSPFSDPPSTTPSTAANQQVETPPSTSSGVSNPASELSFSQGSETFFPPLPWSSVGDLPFPHKRRQPKRRVRRSDIGTSPVTFPPEDTPSLAAALQKEAPDASAESPEIKETDKITIGEAPASSSITQASPVPASKTPDTDQTSSVSPSQSLTPQAAKKRPTSQPKSSRPVVPVIPVVPALPLSPKVSRQPKREPSNVSSATAPSTSTDSSSKRHDTPSTVPKSTTSDDSEPSEPPKKTSSAPIPKSWAEMVRSTVPPKPDSTASAAHVANGLGPAKTETLSDVLNTLNVTAAHSAAKIAFLQPRGLVNTGNMCYMNSVLQVLAFCIPFYEFLERIGQRSTHAFKSETPLVDAMILFMREFSVIKSADSVEQLKSRLRPDDLEQYGDAFIPEYVYQVVRQLPRFRDMRRGQQQDAQEFLGFLLEELHDECAHAMRNGSSTNSGTSTPTETSTSVAEGTNNEEGWMEVGHKQRPSVTRSSGTITSVSPITKIFGGKLRSEWKVPGNKNSVTLEPYQPLQLDIGSPQVHNIIDALKGLTRPESLQGDFNSSRGNKVTATKQVLIETLPPVLVLHLKRFQYDSNTKRTEKIWKKVGYPLDLEMPKEVFPIQARNKFALHGGLPHYQLAGVIYHHGKNASGGHYTVDVRRQDGKEWIRLDDTVIRRVRSDDVAEGGSEEDPKALAAALARHNQPSKSQGGNMFEHFEDGADGNPSEDENSNAWNQVNGHSRNKHSTATVTANGTSSPTSTKSPPQTPIDRFAFRENKVAYLLFYRRVSS